jgi:hypothetical protein
VKPYKDVLMAKCKIGQLGRKKRPVGKKYVSNWENYFFQLET